MNKIESTAQRGNKELASLIGSHREALTASLANDWAAHLPVPEKEVAPLVSTTLDQLVDALDAGAAGRLVDPFAEWAGRQVEKGMDVGGLWRLTHSLNRRLWDIVVETQIPSHPASENGEAIAWLRELTDLIALAQVVAMDTLVAAHDTRQREALDQEQARTARLAEAQARLAQQVRDLSSPVIKVWEEVLILPLVGDIGSDRAARVTEDLLRGIVAHQASIVIMDVTGVSVVDTNVANHLMQTIKAAGLLGAHCVLVGISAEVAQTMVHLGVDLEGVETRSNLQSGIEFALQALHLRIVPQDQVGVKDEVS
jgi:anti-anti-sigma regulatory factor